MKVWYWNRTKNFGDALGPAILKRLGLKFELVERMGQADLVTCGSVLGFGRFQNGCRFWGTGIMDDSHGGLHPTVADTYEFLAVRGELTRIYAKAPDDVVMGDPGILVPELWTATGKRSGLGVVPHYVDKRQYPFADRVINVQDDVDTVIRDIASCDRILSSSLHGLIVAQAYGIPAMRLHHPAVKGGDFKWADYQSAWKDSLPILQENLLKTLPG